MSRRLDQISVISIGVNSHFYLNLWKNHHKPTKLKLSRVCSQLKAALSIESSLDDSLLFIGGNSSLDPEVSSPTISVIDVSDFDRVREISSFTLDGEGMVACLKLQRVENSEGRELLLASGS